MTNMRCLAAALCGLAIFLSACTSGGAARVEPSHVTIYQQTRACEAERPNAPGMLTPANERRPGAIVLDCFRFPEDKDTIGPAKLAYARATHDVANRNRLANILISQADSICTIEKSLMLERQAEVNGWLSIATTGLSIASTIVTGEQASNILSGGAAFTSGSRDHVNTHVWRNQIIETITSAIDTERSQALDRIRTSLGRDIMAYSIDAAIRDVNAYHQLCSFGTGMQVVMKAVEKQLEYRNSLRADEIEEQIALLEEQRGRPLADVDGINATIARLNSEKINLTTGVDLSDAPSAARDRPTPDAPGGAGDGEGEGGPAQPDAGDPPPAQS